MSYKKESVKLNKLLVNPENPRFEPVKSQEGAILTMMEEVPDKIKTLAEDIVEYGLNPGKSIYVVPHKDKYLVMEGNRRVVALKLLDNPSIVNLDKKTLSFFKELGSKENKYIKNKLDVVIFEKEEDIYHWMELEHTGENKGAGSVGWNSKQKDRFKSQIKGEKVSKGMQVLDFMEDSDIEIEGITKTNMDRLLGTPEVREKIGVQFKNGELKIDNKKKVLENLNIISKEMRKDDFNVGEIYYADQRKDWINKTLKSQESKSKQNKDKKEKTKKKDKRSLPARRKFLIPKRCVIKIRKSRLNKIFRELKEISVDDYENAVSVLFRVFLEGSVDAFIEENNIKVKQNKRHNPSLSKKVEKVRDNLNLDKNEKKIINKTISSKNSIYSIDTFHSYVHNNKLHPSPKDLKNTWDNLEPIIKKIWKSIK